MATYTVNISGTFNQTYGYLTINGTKITTAGTRTYSSKPTIKAFVSSSQSNLRSKCYVSHNGTVLKSGYGEYTLSIDAETMDIKMLQVEDPSTYLYYAVEITTKVPSEPHNTNIGGTAREFESGTVLIGGVLREIESGLVLVGGVAREIALAKKEMVLMTFANAPTSAVEMVTIDGKEYTKAGDYEIEKGSVVKFFTKSENPGSMSLVMINTERVFQHFETTWQAYDYVASGNINVAFYGTSDSDFGRGYIAITEQ